MIILPLDNLDTNEKIENEIIKATGLDKENINIKNFILPDKETAEDYLTDMLKIYDCVFVKYYEPIASFKETETYKDLEEKLISAEDSYANFPESLILNFSEQKSSSRSCNSCKSTFNKELYSKKLNIRINNIIETHGSFETLNYVSKYNLKSVVLKCPICDSEEFIWTKTDEKNLNVIQNKINDCSKKIKEAEIEFDIKTGKLEKGIYSFRK